MADLRRSLVINFLSSSSTTLLQFFVSLILARILSPAEIGIYSMTIVFVNITHVFRDFGVSAYLQREKELTPEKLRAATGVVFSSSWLIATVLLLGSPWIGRWLNHPESIPVLRVLAIGFYFIPFGSVTHALLARDFEAKKDAFAVMTGIMAFSITCITLAKLGFGSMSLAYANLVNILVSGLAYMPMRPKYLPWGVSFRNWRSVANFGAGTLISNCANTINNAIPDLLLGKLGSARSVGLLSRANSTVTIFSYVAGSTVSYGAMSYLAQTHHRGESLVPTLSRATSLLTGVGWTALAVTAVLGKDVIQALYGPGWLESVPAILPLALGSAISMSFHYTPIALTSIGKPYLSAAPIAVTMASRIGFGLALFDGSLNNFAWALCLATAAAAPVVAMQQKKYIGYGFRTFARKLVPSAVVALSTAAAAYAMEQLVPASLPALVRLMIMALPLATVWYLLLRATRHALVDEVHRLAAPVKARLALLLPNV
jgi:O-antigen/teichoic acid export membrane protein